MPSPATSRSFWGLNPVGGMTDRPSANTAACSSKPPSRINFVLLHSRVSYTLGRHGARGRVMLVFAHVSSGITKSCSKMFTSADGGP